MPSPNLRTIRSKVNHLAGLVGASESQLPTFGPKGEDSRHHVEVTGGELHYVFVERGEEKSRFSTYDIDELLYVVLRDATAEIASKYELAHRVPDEDTRRQRFQKHEDLLALLSPAWAERRRAEHNEILRQSPYDDAWPARTRLFDELRAKGYAHDPAWALAVDSYPLPVSCPSEGGAPTKPRSG